MKIEAYKGEMLAATFEYGRRPDYRGLAGQQVKELVERPHQVHNLWTGETLDRPLPNRLDWWATDIFSAGLRQAGFAVRFTMPATLAVPQAQAA